MRVGFVAFAFATATASLDREFHAYSEVRHQVRQNQTSLNHFVVKEDPVNCEVWRHPVVLLEADHRQNAHVHVGHHEDGKNSYLHFVVIIVEFDHVRKLHENNGSDVGHNRVCDTTGHGDHRSAKAIGCVLLTNFIFRISPNRPKVSNANPLVVAVALVNARHLCIFQVLSI